MVLGIFCIITVCIVTVIVYFILFLFSSGNSVFLIDHAWTYEVKYAKLQLEQHPTLLARMVDLMDIDVDEFKGMFLNQIRMIELL